MAKKPAFKHGTLGVSSGLDLENLNALIALASMRKQRATGREDRDFYGNVRDALRELASSRRLADAVSDTEMETAKDLEDEL